MQNKIPWIGNCIIISKSFSVYLMLITERKSIRRRKKKKRWKRKKQTRKIKTTKKKPSQHIKALNTDESLDVVIVLIRGWSLDICLLCRFHAIIIFSTRSRDQPYCLNYYQCHLFEMFSIVIWLWLFVRCDGNRLNWNQIVMIIVFRADQRDRYDVIASFLIGRTFEIETSGMSCSLFRIVIAETMFFYSKEANILSSSGLYFFAQRNWWLVQLVVGYRYFNISIKTGFV